MKIPETYQGPLRYVRSYRSSADALEERLLEALTERVEVNGEAVSLHLVFTDYGDKIVRCLPYIGPDTLDRALEWYHESQEGSLMKAVIGKPNERFEEPPPTDDF